MENCTIYSHYLAFDKVVDIVKTHLTKAKVTVVDNGSQKSLVATIKNGFFGKSKTLKINYRERSTPSYTLAQVNCGLTQNLAGMVNFVQSFPAANPHLRDKFVLKIMAANAEMPFMAEPSMNEEFRLILKRIVVGLDAFIFATPSSTFDHSDSQHFVDKHFKLIIDPHGTSEIDDIDISIESKYKNQDQNTTSKIQQARKERSEVFLTSHNVKVNPHLPCIIDDQLVEIRTEAEIVFRAYSLLVIAARGEGVEKSILDKFMHSHNIPSLSPKEMSVYHSDEISQENQAYATWRYESLNVLLWAMGIVPLDYPSELCDVPAIVELIYKQSREQFTKSIKMRTKTEILDELDKVYRMHWSCVDARINNQQVSGELQPSVIYERHYALNWLINYEDAKWDDVSTST